MEADYQSVKILGISLLHMFTPECKSAKSVITVVTPLTAIMKDNINSVFIVLAVSILFACRCNIFNQKDWQQLIICAEDNGKDERNV